MPGLQPDSPRIDGHRITRLLGRWAATHRLDARRADAIHREIVTSPAAPDFDRLWRLLDPVNGTVFRARRPRPGAEIVSPEIEVVPWRWHHEEPDFQPYLRL